MTREQAGIAAAIGALVLLMVATAARIPWLAPPSLALCGLALWCQLTHARATIRRCPTCGREV